jgi:hypothetical protein
MRVSDLQFKKERFGVRAELRQELGLFLGHSISVTAPVDYGEEKPDDEIFELIDRILADLKEILSKAEKVFLEREDDKSLIQFLDNIHISIPEERESNIEEGDHPGQWALVIERSDWDSFGWHIEFIGPEFQEIWAGS